VTRLGVLSDSHGHDTRTVEAVRRLIDAGAEILIHLGDIETAAVLDALAAARIPTHIVFGNCDWDSNPLAEHARRIGVNVDDPMGHIEVASRRIAFTHGHLDRLMQQAIADGVDYLFHGHTHELRDEIVQGTRVINPGALYRAARYTAAVLDPASDRLEIIDVSP
jgi:putative phosphoesterase